MPAIKVKATKTLQTLGRVIKRELMVRDMSKNTNVKLTLSEEEFRLLSDLVSTAGQFVNAGHFSRSINSSDGTQASLGEKLRQAGEESGIENVYGIGITWFQQGFRSKCSSMTEAMTEADRWTARNNDEVLDHRALMLHLLAFEQAKRDYFNGSRKNYSDGRNIKDYFEWFQIQDCEMSLMWSRVWLNKYLDEYKKNGISNIKLNLWTRLKMLFWSPPKRQ
jgi:hypothetical protein